MKRFFETILSSSTGLPVEGALVTVYLAGTSTAATLYGENDPGSEALDNPIETAVDGEVSFYVADGSYDLHVAEGSTGRWRRDVEIYDLDLLASGLGLVDRLTAFGAVPDAQMAEDGAMTAATATLTCASAPFSPADVGKAIVVGGAGAAGAKLRTIVEAYLGPTQLTLAASAATGVAAAGVAWGTDCSPALQAALEALDAARGGTLVIDGYFLLTGPVAIHHFAAVTSSKFNIVGTGTNSAFVIALGSDETAISLSAAKIDMRDISFVGVPGATDARRVLFFNGVTLRLNQCQFLGLLTTDQAVSATASYVYSEHNAFGGTFCLTDGVGFSPARSTFYVDDWYSFSDRGSEFIDYGDWRGLSLSKSGSSGTSAFVGIGTPNASHLTSAARSAGIATFTGTAFDEGSNKGIWAEPASGVIPSLALIGTRHNVNDVIDSAGVYARSVRDVLVDRCSFGLAPSAGTAFGEFVDCGRVILDSLTLLHGVNRVRATNVDALVVRDTDIEDYDLISTAFFPQSSAAGAFALIKAGAVTDSDFPAEPAPGTIAYDRTDGRLYLRSIGDWIYFNMDGGSLLGPELVANGTFATGTTGWIPVSSTLSVVGGMLRVTNTALFGKAVQSFPVEIGRQYAFSREVGAGSPQIRLGKTLGGADYLSTSVSGTTNFTATFATIFITLIVNAESVGATADFDSISLRAV